MFIYIIYVLTIVGDKGWKYNFKNYKTKSNICIYNFIISKKRKKSLKFDRFN